MNPPLRVVFVFNEFSLHNHILGTYLKARPGDWVALVKIPMVMKGKSRMESANRILPQLSRRFIAGKLAEFGGVTALTLMPKILARGAVFQRLRSIARRHGLPFMKADNVMAPEALDFIRAREPDVVVTLVHQFLKQDLIEIPRLGVVNIHPGLLPEFRGIQPYFWELSEGYGRAGATLHLIEDTGVDTGGLLARTEYETWPGMSVQLNYYLTCRSAGALLPECIAALGEGALRPRSQAAEDGRYFRWPDSAAFDRLRTRGHSLVSLRDLWGITSGKWDNFAAGQRELYR
jgi:folate-dependent phosphoribosylglycinamide formyltransferase PurN